MNVNAKTLHEKFFEALNGNSNMYIDYDGDIFNNGNADGLLASGSLDKPHLAFFLSGCKREIVQYSSYWALKADDFEAGLKKLVLKEENQILSKIKDVIEKWDGETTKEYPFSEFFSL